MKIHSPRQNVIGKMAYASRACCSAAVLGAVALCVTTCTTVNAQVRTLGDLEGTVDANLVQNGLFTHGDEAYRVVDTAAFRTAADVDTPALGTVQQVQHAGCSSCGTVYSDPSSCGSCGTGCGTGCDSAFGYGYGATGYACDYAVQPCAPCRPYRYGSFEALYMNLDHADRFSLSPNFNLSGYDMEPGGRLTIGCVPDCVHGMEVTYLGHFQWEQGGLAIDPGNGLQTVLSAVTPFVPANISAFTNASSQLQTYRSEYWSIEANQTVVGWDMAKVLTGFRYMEFDEEYNYFSSTGTETGALRSGVDNRLLGLQCGLELLYPISKIAYTDFRGRLGGYINYAESNLLLINDGTLQVANNDDKTDLAGMFELGGGVRFQLGPALTVRAGAEFWYLARVATSEKQLRTGLVNPALGRRTRTNDDVLMGGVSIGGILRF